MTTSVHDGTAVSSAVDSVTGGCTSPGGARCERGTQVRHATRRAIELNRDLISNRERRSCGGPRRCSGACTTLYRR